MNPSNSTACGASSNVVSGALAPALSVALASRTSSRFSPVTFNAPPRAAPSIRPSVSARFISGEFPRVPPEVKKCRAAPPPAPPANPPFALPNHCCPALASPPAGISQKTAPSAAVAVVFPSIPATTPSSSAPLPVFEIPSTMPPVMFTPALLPAVGAVPPFL